MVQAVLLKRNFWKKIFLPKYERTIPVDCVVARRLWRDRMTQRPVYEPAECGDQVAFREKTEQKARRFPGVFLRLGEGGLSGSSPPFEAVN